MSREILSAAEAMRDGNYCQALKDLLYQLADDDLVMGHRDSEWLGLAPELEEDVAFSSIAQDEVGHATLYYELLHALGEADADSLAFARSADAHRNASFVELENGDWANTMVRHYFYDVFEDIRLAALEQSAYRPLSQGAVKIRREEYYHRMHHQLWFERLLKAGGEARDRMVSAIQALWSEVPGLFDLGPHAKVLLDAGILPITQEEMFHQWLEVVDRTMADCHVTAPTKELPTGLDRSHHTIALETLLATMCEVKDSQHAAAW